MVVAACEAVEASADAEVGDGNVGVAKGLDGLGGDLDVAKKGDVVDVVEADVVDEFAVFFDLQGLAFAADFEALGVEVEGALFVAGGNEAAHFAVRGRSGVCFGSGSRFVVCGH